MQQSLILFCCVIIDFFFFYLVGRPHFRSARPWHTTDVTLARHRINILFKDLLDSGTSAQRLVIRDPHPAASQSGGRSTGL